MSARGGPTPRKRVITGWRQVVAPKPKSRRRLPPPRVKRPPQPIKVVVTVE